MEDLAPKEMPISELYESSIRNAYGRARDTAAKSNLVMSKTEPRSKDAVDFDFDTELRRTRRSTILDRPRVTYKTLQKDDKILSGEPANLSDDEDDKDDTTSGYVARRPYTQYDRETTVYGNRRYYSRANMDDPDYFDFDLNHSIDLYRKPTSASSDRLGEGGSYFNSRVVGNNPALWNSNDFKQLCNYKPNQLLSKQLYSDRTKKLLDDDSAEGAAEGETVAAAQANREVEINKGLMSAALRTPAYWTRRFESLTNLK